MSGLLIVPIIAWAGVDSSNVALVGSVPGYIYSVEVDSARSLLVAGGLGGVAIFDIADPVNPVHLSGLPFEVVLDVSLNGDYLLVSAYEQGLAIVDISDPSSPQILSVYHPDSGSVDVVYGYGNLVVVGMRSSGLYAIDISNPSSPLLLDTLSVGTIYEIFIRNDTIFAAGGNYDFIIVDATNPSSLNFVTGYTSGFFRWATDLKVIGDTVYLADMGEGLRVVDISDPTSPVDVDSLDTYDYAQRLDVSGNYAYLGTSDDTLFVVNLSTMSVVGTYVDEDDLRDVVVMGNLAYLAVSDGGVRILDISYPSSVSIAGNFNTPSFTVAIAIRDNYAYAGDWSSGLTVLDISDIRFPRIVKTIDEADFVQDLFVQGDYLYVANAFDGILVFDISDPANPLMYGNYNTSGIADGVYVSGNYAYVADNYGDLVVLDVSIPGVPSPVATFEFPGRALDVVGRDSLLFIAAGDSGMVIVDVSNPSSPSLVGQFVPSSDYIYCEKIYVKDTLAFLSNYYELYVLDVSNPASPSVVLVDSFGGEPVKDVNGYSNLVYITVWDSGMRVMDLSSPEPLAYAGYYDPYISSFRDGTHLWTVSS